MYVKALSLTQNQAFTTSKFKENGWFGPAFEGTDLAPPEG